MPQKVRNSGRSGHFQFSSSHGWQTEQIHGWEIWIDAKHYYKPYSPRLVALAEAMRMFWIQNKGTQFPWEETLASLRFYIRSMPNAAPAHRVSRVSRTDYGACKEIIRELGPRYMDPDGSQWVYGSTRGSSAVSGFVEEQVDAVVYEVKNHQMLRVMEARIANGTVDPAGQKFGLPVHNRQIKTKTLR